MMSPQTLDQQLNEVESLSWLPWVGPDYLRAPPERRILIIGESHYNEGGDAGKSGFSDRNITRNVLRDFAINQQSGRSRFFSNIKKVLVNDQLVTTEHFWNKVAFYNFIQTPMNGKKGRPSSGDFNNGWEVFFNLLPILKPSTCLFIGVSSSYQYKGCREKSRFETEELTRGEQIGSTYARQTYIKYEQDKLTNLHFIKHTSARFSCRNWNQYLVRTIPDEVSWLSSVV